MIEKKRLMILQAGQSQIRIIQTAKNMGLEVIATDRNKDAPGFEYADYSKDIDVIDKNNTLKYAEEMKINGILPGGDISLATAAFVSQNLGIVGLTTEQAELATNKELYYELFKKKKIPYPQTKIVKTLEECIIAIEEIGYPAIVKPTTSFGGSRGVKRINSVDDIETSFNFAKIASRNQTVMVEEFLEGEEHTVESIVFNGNNHILAVSDKIRIKDAYCLATSLHYPSQLPKESIDKITSLAKRAAEAFELDNWITHIEVISNGDDIKIIDFGARGGGAGYIPAVIIPHLTGVNMMEEYIRILMGEKTLNVNGKIDGAIVFRFFTPPAGKVIAIEGVEHVKSMKEIIDFHLYVKEGDIIPLTRTQLDRSGYFVVKGNSFQKTMVLAKQIEDQVKIVTEDVDF